MLLPFISQLAKAEDTDCVVVEFQDENTIVYRFTDKPHIFFEENNVRILSSTSVDATYPFDQVKKVYFSSERVEVSRPKENSDAITFDFCSSDIVKVSGLRNKDSVGVYTAGGMLLKRYSGNDNIEIDLSNYEKGMYIINVNNNKSFKIIRK